MNAFKVLQYAGLLLIALFVVSRGIAAGQTENETPASPIAIEITTTAGNIVVELYADAAPLTVAYFLDLVDQEYYDRGSFFRVLRPDTSHKIQVSPEHIFTMTQGGVIQGGPKLLADGRDINTVPHESTQLTGLRHRDGALSLARVPHGQANSAFFISIGEHPYYDYGGDGEIGGDGEGYAVFGQVIAGMEVVERINQGRTKGTIDPNMVWNLKTLDPKQLSPEQLAQLQADKLLQPVTITKIRRVPQLARHHSPQAGQH